MKSYLIIASLLILLNSEGAFAQGDSLCKHKIYIEAGGHYSLITGQRFINYTPLTPITNPDINKYAGFIRFPTSNIQFGLLYNYRLTNVVSIRTGISYFNRTWKYKSDSATIAMYNENKNIIEYYISENNIDIPLFLGFDFNKFSLYAGSKINILGKKEVLMKDIRGNSGLHIENYKLPRPFLSIWNLYPSLRLVYQKSLLKRIPLLIYSGVDMRSKYYYDIQLGVEVQIKEPGK